MKRNRTWLVAFLLAAALFLQAAAAQAGEPDQPSLAAVSVPAAQQENQWRHWTAGVDLSACPVDKASWPTWGIEADGQTLYLAWSDGRDGASNIYHTRSQDGGESWNSALRLWESSGSSVRPSMAVWGTTPHVAWADETAPLQLDTYYMPIDGSTPTVVPNDHVRLASVPRLAVSQQGDLHLALQGGLGTQPDIRYTSKSTAPSSWPAAVTVAEHQASGASNPAIAVSNDGNVHLVWQENRNQESDILYVSGQPSGETINWGTPVTLSVGITASVRPAIVSRGSNSLYVAWGEKAPDIKAQYVRLARSANGGASWSAPERVEDDPVSANSVAPTDVAPALAVLPSGAVCVAWHGFEPGATYEAEEVWVSCSLDEGETWQRKANVSGSTSVISIRPILASGGDGILHIAWQESAGGDPRFNYQIYYAHSIPYVIHLPQVFRSYP